MSDNASNPNPDPHAPERVQQLQSILSRWGLRVASVTGGYALMTDTCDVGPWHGLVSLGTWVQAAVLRARSDVETARFHMPMLNDRDMRMSMALDVGVLPAPRRDS